MTIGREPLNMAVETEEIKEVEQQTILEPDVEAIPDKVPVEDVKGLKSTLIKYKERANAAEEAAKAQADRLAALEKTIEKINPEEYERLKTAEAESAKLRDEMAKLSTTLREELKREYDARAEIDQKAKIQAEEKFIELNRRSDTNRYFNEAGGIGKHFTSFDRLIRDHLEYAEDGTVKRVLDANKTPIYVTDEKNKKAREITAIEFFLECRQGKHGPILQNCFEPYNKASGSGFGAGVKGDDGVIYLPKSEMSEFMSGGGDPARAKENTLLVRQGKVRWQ